MKISIDLKYKYKKLIKYLIIFIFLCILIYFSTNVSASTVPSSCIFYDNFGTSQTQLLTISGENYYKPENSFTLTANSYGSLVICSLDTPLVQDNLYSLSYFVDLEGTDANSILSKKSNLGIGNTIEQARSSYINNTNTDLKYNNASSSNLSYIFTAKTNASFIAIPFGSNKTVSTTPKLTNLSISSNGNVNKLSQNDIQNIIDNSNNKLNDTINDSLNNCIKNIIPHDNYISSTGEVVINSSNDSIQWLSLGTLTLSPGNYSLLANTGNSGIMLVIDSLREYDTSTTKQFTLTSSVSTNVYIRVSPGTYNNVKFKPGIMTGFTSNYALPGQISCTSKLDDTNKNLNDLNDSLKDSKTDGATSDASNFFNNFTTTDNGGISSIITSPLRLINALLSNSNSCNDLSLQIDMVSLKKDVSLPCGSILWSKVPNSTIIIYHTLIFGLASFFILVSLYHDIEDIKKPDDKGVKTTDL